MRLRKLPGKSMTVEVEGGKLHIDYVDIREEADEINTAAEHEARPEELAPDGVSEASREKSADQP